MNNDGSLIRVYQFVHRHRAVYIQADNPDQANHKFQERFGYYPTIENQEENERSQADGTSEV